MAMCHAAASSTGLCRLRSEIRTRDFLENPASSVQPRRRLLPIASIEAAGTAEQQLRPVEMSVPSLQRRSGNYPPSLWTPFLNSLQTPSKHSEEIFSKRIATLKEKISYWVKGMLNMPSTKLLELVDNIQQLGLSYHFDEEIKAALDQVTNNMSKILEQNDLHTTSLLFRLLRNNGYTISQDVFANFVDEEGNLVPSIYYGIKEMLGLYEASFYQYEGEYILDKAKIFSYSSLGEFLKSDEKSFGKEKVMHALEHPIHWRMPRLHTRWFINIYSKEADMQPELLELAKFDFSRVQHEYQMELKELSSWWSRLGLMEKMPYARDRLVELFLFAIGMQFEPQFGYFRVELSKLIVLITVVDDLYDVYGTLEELELFTQIVERWDVVYAMEKLPDYMKICFMALFNTVNELAYDILRDKGMEVAGFLKKIVSRVKN